MWTQPKKKQNNPLGPTPLFHFRVVAALPAFGVAPDHGTAPSATGLSQFIPGIISYQPQTFFIFFSTGAWLSTHLLLRSAPLPVIIEADTVPPWLSSCIAFTTTTTPPPARPQFSSSHPSAVPCAAYRSPKTLSPGQADLKLANNLESVFCPCNIIIVWLPCLICFESVFKAPKDELKKVSVEMFVESFLQVR